MFLRRRRSLGHRSARLRRNLIESRTANRTLGRRLTAVGSAQTVGRHAAQRHLAGGGWDLLLETRWSRASAGHRLLPVVDQLPVECHGYIKIHM